MRGMRITKGEQGNMLDLCSYICVFWPNSGRKRLNAHFTSVSEAQDVKIYIYMSTTNKNFFF